LAALYSCAFSFSTHHEPDGIGLSHSELFCRSDLDGNCRFGLLCSDLILGVSGAHSSFSKTFKAVAAEENVNLLKLIVEVSKLNRKNPNEELMRTAAKQMKGE